MSKRSATVKLLLIDDDEVDAESVRRLLGDEYQIAEARTGKAACELLQQHTPDCGLLDYMLPDMSGLDVLPCFREKSVPVVMLTGQGNTDIAVQTMQQGAQEYLSKDKLTRESLQRAIGNAIEKASLQKAVEEQHIELHRRAEALERSNIELERFAYVTSHDLREPLRSISCYCELLKEHENRKLDEEGLQRLDRVIAAARRMNELIEGVRAYSRVSAPDQDCETVDLEQVISAVKDDLESAIRDSGAEIAHGPLPELEADASQMLQLFQNLVANAITYHGPSPPRVRIDAERRPCEWQFCVRDNGIGIPDQHRETIFGMFHRLHREEYPGTGIGLAICRRIVHSHGGRMWVESSPGEGSSFFFTLPGQEEKKERRRREPGNRETARRVRADCR